MADLRLVPPLSDEARQALARAELERVRARIRAAVEQTTPPRERWLRRIVRRFQSTMNYRV
jgi:hypothetical protein